MITSNIILQNNWLMNKMVKPNEDLADQTCSNCRSPRFKLCFMSVFNLAFVVVVVVVVVVVEFAPLY